MLLSKQNFCAFVLDKCKKSHHVTSPIFVNMQHLRCSLAGLVYPHNCGDTSIASGDFLSCEVEVERDAVTAVTCWVGTC